MVRRYALIGGTRHIHLRLRVRRIHRDEHRRTKLRHARTRDCQAERRKHCQEFAPLHGNLLGLFKNGSASGRHPQPDTLTQWPSNAGMRAVANETPNQHSGRANLFQEGFGSGSGDSSTSRAVCLDDSGSGRDTSADDVELESTAAEAPPAASPDPVSSRAASTSTSKSTSRRAASPSGSSSGLYPATTIAARFG